ncbi:hypothetical protein GOP47_0002386, partial [Adiantum capillus-veneris]
APQRPLGQKRARYRERERERERDTHTQIGRVPERGLSSSDLQRICAVKLLHVGAPAPSSFHHGSLHFKTDHTRPPQRHSHALPPQGAAHLPHLPGLCLRGLAQCRSPPPFLPRAATPRYRQRLAGGPFCRDPVCACPSLFRLRSFHKTAPLQGPVSAQPGSRWCRTRRRRPLSGGAPLESPRPLPHRGHERALRCSWLRPEQPVALAALLFYHSQHRHRRVAPCSAAVHLPGVLRLRGDRQPPLRGRRPERQMGDRADN